MQDDFVCESCGDTFATKNQLEQARTEAKKRNEDQNNRQTDELIKEPVMTDDELLRQAVRNEAFAKELRSRVYTGVGLSYRDNSRLNALRQAEELEKQAAQWRAEWGERQKRS
jgi:hypothetical protein